MNLGTILILDDDADVLRAARIALISHAANIDTAMSRDGLERHLSAAQYEAVLLDMNFTPPKRNGEDGIDALQRIRAFDPTLSVVLMTAYGGVALAVESLKLGAVDFILKPWRNEKLVSAVTGAVVLTRERRKAEDLDLQTLERTAIERALSRHAHNLSVAAAVLGLSRAALYRRMAKYGL